MDDVDVDVDVDADVGVPSGCGLDTLRLSKATRCCLLLQSI